MNIIVYSQRYYGEPKLKKPEVLRGLSKLGTVKFNPKCSCPVFIQGKDIWIKHRDWFSPSFRSPVEDLGAPLSVTLKKYFDKTRSEKFNYPDCWGDIVLRSEAWIVIHRALEYRKNAILNDGLVHNFPFDCVLSLSQQLGVDWTELPLEWERFFEGIQKLCSEHRKV